MIIPEDTLLTKEYCDNIIKMYQSDVIVLKYVTEIYKDKLYHKIKIHHVKYGVTLIANSLEDFFSIINMYNKVLTTDTQIK